MGINGIVIFVLVSLYAVSYNGGAVIADAVCITQFSLRKKNDSHNKIQIFKINK